MHPVSEDSESDRLRRLEEKLAAAKAAREKPARGDEGQYSAAGLAWRMVTELVAGMGLGLLIGLGLDTLFGTQPILMVVFLVLGLIAGIRVMMRTAAEMGQDVAAASAAAERKAGGARRDGDAPRDETEEG